MLILFLIFISQAFCRFLYNYLNFAETRPERGRGSPAVKLLITESKRPYTPTLEPPPPMDGRGNKPYDH